MLQGRAVTSQDRVTSASYGPQYVMFGYHRNYEHYRSWNAEFIFEI